MMVEVRIELDAKFLGFPHCKCIVSMNKLTSDPVVRACHSAGM